MDLIPTYLLALRLFYPENDNKITMVTVFKDNTFLFVYDIKNTTLNEFSDLSHFDISNFWPNIKILVEMQIYLQNFKTKRENKNSQVNQKYLFKLVDIYKLYDVKIPPPSTLEKRQKVANK